MTTRPVLALFAVLASAAAVIGLLLVPAINDRADDPPARPDERAESLMDGWANRDVDISAFGVTYGFGSLLDGWANRDLDIGAFTTTYGVGSWVDGWAAQDLDLRAP